MAQSVKILKIDKFCVTFRVWRADLEHVADAAHHLYKPFRFSISTLWHVSSCDGAHVWRQHFGSGECAAAGKRLARRMRRGVAHARDYERLQAAYRRWRRSPGDDGKLPGTLI